MSLGLLLEDDNEIFSVVFNLMLLGVPRVFQSRKTIRFSFGNKIGYIYRHFTLCDI
jgi:hypothetical protein